MAFLASFKSFSISLSNAERDSYVQRRVKIPLFEDESERELFARLLAWCHSYTVGLDFVSNDDSEIGAVAIARDLYGEISHWIAVGEVSERNVIKATQLRRATTRAVYFTTEPEIHHFCRYLKGATENWAAALEFYLISEELLGIDQLPSSSELQVTFVDGATYLTLNGVDLVGSVSRVDIWQRFQEGLVGGS